MSEVNRGRLLCVQINICYGVFILSILLLMAGHSFWDGGIVFRRLFPIFSEFSEEEISTLGHQAVLLQTFDVPTLDSLRAFYVAMYPVALIATLMLVYKVWEVLPPYRARTTPLRAALFLLIPLFNIYWQFVVCVGFAKDANRVLQHRGIADKFISKDIAMWLCIAGLLVFAPYLGNVFQLVFLILGLIFLVQVRSAALAIARTNRKRILVYR